MMDKSEYAQKSIKKINICKKFMIQKRINNKDDN